MTPPGTDMQWQAAPMIAATDGPIAATALPTAGTAVPAARASSAYPYETPAFHQCWWEHLAPRFDIPFKNRDLLVTRKPVLKGLLKLREVRVSGWNNAWVQDLTPERVMELHEVDHTTAWDVFRIVWSEARPHQPGLDALAAFGYPFLTRPAPPQYVADMTGGFEAYLAGLSHNSRKSLRKKTRRAEPLNPQLVPCETERDIDTFFEDFFSHHIPYWNARAPEGSYLKHAEERRFIVAWAKALRQSGHLAMDRLMMDDEPVNFSMGAVFGDTFYWLLTVNTGRHAEFAPGIVGLSLRLRQMAARGVTRFNMGAGDYFYKAQSANCRESCHETLVFNPRSPKGQVFYHCLKRKPATAPMIEPASPDADIIFAN